MRWSGCMAKAEKRGSSVFMPNNSACTLDQASSKGDGIVAKHLWCCKATSATVKRRTVGMVRLFDVKNQRCTAETVRPSARPSSIKAWRCFEHCIMDWAVAICGIIATSLARTFAMISRALRLCCRRPGLHTRWILWIPLGMEAIYAGTETLRLLNLYCALANAPRDDGICAWPAM